MSLKWTRTLAAAAVLGMGALTGCGSDDDGSDATPAERPAASTAPTTEAAPSEAATGDPIVLGNIGSYTGAQEGTLAKAGDVIQAWAKDVNATGGINGHPVKIISIDDAGNPAKALAAMKKLVEQDKVMAIVSDFSFASQAWQKYAEQKKIPIVGGASTDTPFMSSPVFFPSGATLAPTLYGVMDLAKKAGAKKIGAMYCSETPVCAQLLPVLQGVGSVIGLQVEGQKVSQTAANYTAPCLALKSKDVDALWPAVTSAAAPRIVSYCARQGYKPIPVAPDSTVGPTSLKSPELEGLRFSGTNAVYTATNLPGVRKYNALIDKYLPEVRDSVSFSLPLTFSYAAGELFRVAAEKGNIGPDSTPADVTKALYTIKGETLGGLAPPLTFVEGQPKFGFCYFANEIKGGEFVADNDGAPVCADDQTAAALGKAFAG